MNLTRYQIVVIGTSAGGFKALHTLLPLFGRKFSLPIVVVQHRQAEENPYLVSSWAKGSKLKVREAVDGDLPVKGEVYVAPAGHHLIFGPDKTFKLTETPPVNFSRPSIDVSMSSAAEIYGEATVGVILTGASQDGAAGMLKIHQKGGLTIAQLPSEAEVDFMPRAAMKIGAVDFVLTLKKIPDFLSHALLDSRVISSSSWDFE